MDNNKNNPPIKKNNWRCVLGLDKNRKLISGKEEELTAAISRGADLRIYTEFRHNEHIDTNSDCNELIKEVADFRITYLLDYRWVAGIINLRQPVELPGDFGPRPSMSFFLYNQNVDQAIARPYLDGQSGEGKFGAAPLDDFSYMPKYHQFDSWDAGTNAPSSNFVYDFDKYNFWVCDDWEEMYCHNAEGDVLSGSIDLLADAFAAGREIKVAIKGLCADLAHIESSKSMHHEVFIHCGSCYYYTERKQLLGASQPVVRVEPSIPLRYKSKNWDFGWLVPRSDGHVASWLVDPYTLQFKRNSGQYAMRWFAR